MKNKRKFLYSILFLFFIKQSFLFAGELNVSSTKIKIDKKTKIAILTGNVEAFDEKNNRLFSDYAKFSKEKELLETEGKTEITTSENFKVIGKNILFDNKKKIISSNDETKIIDRDGNEISVNMFKYLTEKNIFFSKGKINVVDNKNNEYNFSEVYIDEKKGKIVGSDVKAFLNEESLKENQANEPRLFANTMTLTKEENLLEKGVFTYCKDRGSDKCPPWKLQAKKIKHNPTKKTIYYDNAVIKVYDFPIFYFPKFSHPDPTVDRRSGFLIPSFSDNTTLGAGILTPYFWAISNDKDLTFTPKIYNREHPLYLAEYRQSFEKSDLIVDAGYTEGYKKKTNTKLSGSRLHFFSKFNTNFIDETNKSSKLEVNIQHLSNDTYLKIHDVNTTLANEDINILENTVDYNYQSEDLFFGASFSAFEDVTKVGNTKYEYLVPYIAFDKNLLVSEQYGLFDLSSNLRVRNYDVNKQTEFFVNDINWQSNKWINKFGFENQFQGLLKTVNYNAEDADEYKTEDSSAELSGVIGYLAKLGFYKNDYTGKNNHLLTPKLLLRYAPGHMREIEGGRLKYSNLYEINKTNEIDVIEDGLSASIGFDYKKNQLNDDGSIADEKFSFSAGQVISADENMDIPSSTSLDQRFSDLVGETRLKISDHFNLNYNFAIDQSYNEINYSEVGADLDLGKFNFNLSYLEEKNHIGKQEYVESSADFTINESSKLSFSTKRNLLTSSAEFYNLSYDYMNDCLKAGIVFRREFYTDRDIEPDNSLMFRISLIPFAELNSPDLTK